MSFSYFIDRHYGGAAWRRSNPGFLVPVSGPSIPFGVHTTLGYSENSSNTGGTLRVTDGSHIAKLALLGNYMATSFVTAADGHGGTLITGRGQ
jgi:hypothetical protein